MSLLARRPVRLWGCFPPQEFLCECSTIYKGDRKTSANCLCCFHTVASLPLLLKIKAIEFLLPYRTQCLPSHCWHLFWTFFLVLYRDILTFVPPTILHQADKLEVFPAFLGAEVTVELSLILSKHQGPSCRSSSITSTNMDKVSACLIFREWTWDTELYPI